MGYSTSGSRSHLVSSCGYGLGRPAAKCKPASNPRLREGDCHAAARYLLVINVVMGYSGVVVLQLDFLPQASLIFPKLCGDGLALCKRAHNDSGA